MQLSPEIQLAGYSAVTTLIVAATFLFLWHRLRWTRLLSFGASFGSLGILLVYLAVGLVYEAYPFRQQIAAATATAATALLFAGCLAHVGKDVPWKHILWISVAYWTLNQVINATTGVLSYVYSPFVIGLVWLGTAALFLSFRHTKGGRILAALFFMRGAIHIPWPWVIGTDYGILIQAVDKALIIGIGLALVVVELLRARADLAQANLTLQHQAQALQTANEKLGVERQLAVSASNAKSAFLANMSHELRTPLNAIMGFSEILARSPSDKLGERTADYGKDIHNAAGVLLEFVEQILELSRLEAGRVDFNPEAVDVEKLVDRAIATARRKHRTSPADIVKFFEEGTGSVEGDEKLLRRALIGVLTRALRFTGSRGTVRVLAGPEPDDAVRIEISDTGPELDGDELAEAFNPFHVSDAGIVPKGGGIDLGLPLAKRLVEVHGGNIRIESDRENGTTVSIDLPRRSKPH